MEFHKNVMIYILYTGFTLHLLHFRMKIALLFTLFPFSYKMCIGFLILMNDSNAIFFYLLAWVVVFSLGFCFIEIKKMVYVIWIYLS